MKRTETRGVKLLFVKTSRDVGMVPSGGKSIGTRRGMPWHFHNPGQHSPASRHIAFDRKRITPLA